MIEQKIILEEINNLEVGNYVRNKISGVVYSVEDIIYYLNDTPSVTLRLVGIHRVLNKPFGHISPSANITNIEEVKYSYVREHFTIYSQSIEVDLEEIRHALKWEEVNNNGME